MSTFKAVVVDDDGNEYWSGIVTELPASGGRLERALTVAGLKAIRPVDPKDPDRFAVLFSYDDPVRSIKAANEYHDRMKNRRDKGVGTDASRLLLAMLAKPGVWFNRDVVRRIAGDQGDRRFRQIRQANWPVESRVGSDNRDEVRIRPDVDLTKGSAGQQGLF